MASAVKAAFAAYAAAALGTVADAFGKRVFPGNAAAAFDLAASCSCSSSSSSATPRAGGAADAAAAAAAGSSASASARAVAKCKSFHLMLVTPAIHYCMGGLAIDRDGAVLVQQQQDQRQQVATRVAEEEVVAAAAAPAVPGLFAAGEATGGVHGRNRLGGNSLLECVVFGRRAARAAARRVLSAAGTDSASVPRDTLE